MLSFRVCMKTLADHRLAQMCSIYCIITVVLWLYVSYRNNTKLSFPMSWWEETMETRRTAFDNIIIKGKHLFAFTWTKYQFTNSLWTLCRNTHFTHALEIFLILNLHQQSLKIFNIVTVHSQFLWLCGELCPQSFKNVPEKQLLCQKHLTIYTVIQINQTLCVC